MFKRLRNHLLLALIASTPLLNSCLVMPDYVPSADSIIASELKFSEEEITLHVGGSTSLDYFLDKPESKETFIWQPADTTLISVSESGTVQAGEISGKTTITLIAENKERKKNLEAQIGVTVVSNEEFFKTNNRNEITGILDETIYNILLPQKLNNQIVTTIAADAFYNCSNLRTLVIPSGYTTLADHCLDGVSTLVNLQLPSTLTYFGVSYGFLNSLENVYFGSQDRNRNAQNNIFISNAKNFIYEIDTYKDPRTLETREFARIIYAFKDFNAMPVQLTGDPTKLNIWIEEIRSGALYGLETIKKLSLHENLRILGERVFAYSTIQEVTLPDSITSIANAAFSSMPYLTTLRIRSGTGINAAKNYFVIGNSVYQYREVGVLNDLILISGCKSTAFLTGNYQIEIGDYAFDNVFFPTMSLRLPKAIKKIGKSAFRNNKSLTHIDFPSKGDGAEKNETTITTILGNTDETTIRGIDALGSKEDLSVSKTGPFYGCPEAELRVPFFNYKDSVGRPLGYSNYDTTWSIGVKSVTYGHTD